MGLFDIFKKPIYEKYGELICALKEHYQSLRITKTEASIFSMSANHCGNIDNLNITIYRGNAFDEHPAEYRNLYYDNYVFVKTTYSINGEAISIRNAFLKNGNQFMMFTSIIGTEIMKTNYEIELQQKKEEELKKAAEEDEKRMQEIFFQKMREKGLTVDEEKIKEEYKKLSNEVYDGSKDDEISLLTINQKYAFLNLAVSLCFSDPNSLYILTRNQRNILENFTFLLKLDKSFLSNVLEQKHYLNVNKSIEEVRAVHMDGPFINFICTCLDIIEEANEDYFTTLVCTQMLKDIGLSQEDINAALKGKYNFRFDNVAEGESTEETNTSILQSWSLLEFAKNYVKMQVGNFVNSNTGEEFKSCMFIKEDGSYDYVGFHSQLGELTPAEISERKKELKVGLTQSGKYVLYDHIDDWENIDLGL